MRLLWPEAARLSASLALLGLACVLAIGCGAGGSRDSAEAQRVKEAVSSYLQEAYGPGGDLDFAYSLLASRTRESCSKPDFLTIALAARQANGDRSLQTDRFSDIRISGDTATLKVDSDYDLSPRFFPLDATVVKEDGDWRFLVTTDPTCKSVPRFFQHETGSNCGAGSRAAVALTYPCSTAPEGASR